MPINFIPNDPLAQGASPMRKKKPLPNRPSNRAGFKFTGAAPEGQFPPGSPEFLYWQCREAALLTVKVWEGLDGPLKGWSQAAPDPSKLDLFQDAGQQLNAFYDQTSLTFFHHTVGKKTTFSGASTDVVSHEAGHALLDAVRPDIFDSALTELGAFHEAFGDCMAVLVALGDKPTRQALLSPSPKLGSKNFVEAVMEDLSDGVRLALGKSHPAAAPRRALNKFQFQLPTTLPQSGGPSVLTSEIHSFGRVFVGCFYDTIRNIFKASATKGEAALWKAARTAGKLLIAAAKSAPETARFFQAVGRAMVHEDAARNKGANRQAITDAFQAHNIALGTSAMLAPRAALLGGVPQTAQTARGPIINPATVRDLRSRLGATPQSRLSVSPVQIGAERVVKAVHFREVPLGGLSARLKGVVAVAPEAVLIGSEGARPAALSAIPDANTSADEVQTFVQTLLKNGQIDFGGSAQPTARAGRAVAPAVGGPATTPPTELPTHTIATQGGRKVLVRVRFACRH